MAYKKSNANGQATMANSEPVVIASDQSTIPISAASLPIPAGAATVAKQPALGTAGTPSADVITVQGITSMTALKVDGSGVTQPVSGTITANAGSGTQAVSIATAPVLVAGSAIIGKVGIDQTTPGTTNGVQVNAALPAGTNAIGKLSANSGVDIGDVDVTTVGTITPGTLAANLGKAEDAAAASGDTGVFVLGVQRAAPSSNAATGDYVEIQMSPSNGMFVAPQPIQIILSATPTVSSGSIYASGDVVGAALTFTGAASASGRAGQVVGATLIDKGKQSAALQLWLFAVSPTLANADNGIFDITDANLVTALPIGVIDFAAANYKTTNSNAICNGTVNNGSPLLPFVTSGSANIFGVFSTTGTPTYASTSDLVVYLTIDQF